MPFTYHPLIMPGPIIRVSVNGAKPLPFLVDTGLLQPLLVDHRAAKECNRPMVGETVTLSPSNLQVTRVAPCSIAFMTMDAGRKEHADAHLPATAPEVGDLHWLGDSFAGPRVAGVVGLPLLKTFVVRFDFAANMMTLFCSLSAARKPTDAVTLRIQARDPGYFVTISPEGALQAALLVDTGSWYTSLPESVAMALHPSAIQSL